jgi:hypothetical protein
MTNDRQKEGKEEMREFPLLSRLREKGEGFAVPESYFETSRNAILAKVKDESTAQRSTYRLLNLTSHRVQLGIAASVLVLILAAFYFFRAVDNSDPSQEISSEEAIFYAAQYIDNVELEEFIRAAGFTEEDWADVPDLDLDMGNLDEYLEDIIHDLDDEELEKLL